MAVNIGQLVWKITGDTKNIDKSLGKTDSKIAKFGKTVAAAFSVAALVLFAKKAFDVGKALINVASDAEETANKFDVVFAGITRAGEAADNLAESYGFSLEASQNLLSGTADLLQGFGVAKDESLDLSEQVQQLAADLSSFTNNEGGAEAASRALTSAMLGEREAVKSLGIAITDAELKLFAEETGQVFKEMTKGEKAILTLNLAIKQSANAIGDFARSQDNFANQSKIARANIDDLQAIMGEKLLPVATKIVTSFNDIVGEMIDLQKEKINLDKAFAADEAANYTEAIRTQSEIVSKLSAAISKGGRAAQALARSYGISIKALNEQLAVETQALDMLNRIANGVQRAAGERENEAAAIREQNDAEEERIRLLEEERKAEEARARAAIEAHQAEVDARVAAFEEQLRIEEEAALIESEILQIRNDARIAEREAEQDRHDQRISNLQAELAAASQYAGNVGQIFGNLIQIQMAGDDELTDRKIRNIITLYRIQQAANIAQIAVDTAAAIVRAWVSPGFPLAIPLTALIGAIGLTQAAVVAATPPPVKLAAGGVVPARPGGTQAILGEAGKAEAVIPLDSTMGSIRIIVNLDGQPILDTVQSGLNRREIVVQAGSIA